MWPKTNTSLLHAMALFLCISGSHIHAAWTSDLSTWIQHHKKFSMAAALGISYCVYHWVNHYNTTAPLPPLPRLSFNALSNADKDQFVTLFSQGNNHKWLGTWAGEQSRVRNNNRIIKLERDAQHNISGFIVYFMETPVKGYIDYVAVSNAHQRRGIGKRLMQHALADLKKSGAQSIQLRMHKDNHQAQPLYEGLGFANQPELATEHYRFFAVNTNMRA